MTKYDDVRVIHTGEVGMIIEVKDGRFLVDFGRHSEWYDECEIIGYMHGCDETEDWEE